MAFAIKDPPEFTVEIEQWTRDTLADGAEMAKVPEKLLNNELYLKAQIEQAEREQAVRHKQRHILLPASGWSSVYPYTQSVGVEGVMASDTVRVIGVVHAGGNTQEQDKAIDKAAGFLMYNGNGVSEGTITFLAKKKPAVDITVITEGG